MNESHDASLAFGKAAMERLSREMPPSLARFEKEILSSIKKSEGEPLDKLAELYRCTDKIFDFFAQYTPCKKGCSHCCYYMIDVSELEVAFIEKHTGIMREHRDKPLFGTHGMPCPFLRRNECSIYRYRPLACRKYLVFEESEYWCHPDRCHKVKMLLLDPNNIKDTYYDLLRSYGRNALADIRYYFPLGLETHGI